MPDLPSQFFPEPPGGAQLAAGVERGFALAGLMAVGAVFVASLAEGLAHAAAAPGAAALLACTIVGLITTRRVRRAQSAFVTHITWHALQAASPADRVPAPAVPATPAAPAAGAIDQALATLSATVERTGAGAEEAARAAARLAQLACGLGQGVDALAHDVAALTPDTDIAAGLRAETAAMSRRVFEMQRAVEAQHEFSQALAQAAEEQSAAVQRLLAQFDAQSADTVGALRAQALEIHRSYRQSSEAPLPTA